MVVEGVYDISANFIEILHVVAAHDPVVEQRPLHGPKNTKYTHLSIQVEILSLLAKMIHTKIEAEIYQAHFSLMCDETRDSGKREQIYLCIRYVSEGTLCEKFYNFYRADGLSAADITNKLTEVLEAMKIDVAEGVVAQCYDGAHTMVGHLHGGQQRMREITAFSHLVKTSWTRMLWSPSLTSMASRITLELRLRSLRDSFRSKMWVCRKTMLLPGVFSIFCSSQDHTVKLIASCAMLSQSQKLCLSLPRQTSDPSAGSN